LFSGNRENKGVIEENWEVAKKAAIHGRMAQRTTAGQLNRL